MLNVSDIGVLEESINPQNNQQQSNVNQGAINKLNTNKTISSHNKNGI
jgi:hypothetical protein